MNTAATWRVGIDLGGTSLRLLGESENGERSEVTTVPTARDYEDLLNQIESLLNSVVAGPILDRVRDLRDLRWHPPGLCPGPSVDRRPSPQR